jgi:IS30 family transposase
MAGATHRSRYGHFECDTIVSGKNGSGAISVLIDRKSRYVVLNKLDSLKPSEHAEVLKPVLKTLNASSVTFDNGIENKHHESVGVPTFFCDPYSSWQKGSVENVNKMVRRYIPKGTDISTVSQDFLDWIQETINTKPRAVLGFRSSYDIVSSYLKGNPSCCFSGWNELLLLI